ncbi:hypothetical protein MASR2M78_24450 [Treponema sp.]
MGFKRPNFLLGNFYFKILRYFLVLLLPIAITGIISYWISIDSMRRDFTNIIALDLKSSAREVDIYLRAAREIGANILYDDTIRTLLVPNRSTDLRLKSEEYKIPKSILRNKNIVDDFVDDIFIYADQQKIYTEDGAEDFDTFFKSSYVIQGYNIDFWLDLLNTEQQIKILEQSRVLAASGARERNVIPVVTVINTNGYNNVAVVCISADFLHATITEDPIFPNSGFIVTDRNGAVVLASAAYKDTAAKLASTLHTKKNNEAFSRIMIDGKRYATNRVQSDVFSWSFYSFTPLSEFDAKARIILSATFITCLILLILSLIFSFVFSYYLYNPIRHIRSILADEKVASIKGRGNDIEIIDTGIKKLINDFYSHKNELQEITEAYLDKTIRLLLDGEIGDREAEIKKLLTEELGFEKNEFLCVSLKVDYSPAFYSDIPEDEQTAVRHGIKKIILTLMKTERATSL